MFVGGWVGLGVSVGVCLGRYAVVPVSCGLCPVVVRLGGGADRAGARGAQRVGGVQPEEHRLRDGAGGDRLPRMAGGPIMNLILPRSGRCNPWPSLYSRNSLV